MILVITYHKVLASGTGEKSEFYSISAAQLSRQIEILKSAGRECVSLAELVISPTPPENKFVLTFDDATRDHYDVVLPLLEKHHCRGSFYVPTVKLNRDRYLTSAQIREMAAAGHEIGSHSHKHQRMDLLSEVEVRQQITRSQEIIADITGSKPVTFVPPGGFMNGCIRSVAHGLGIRAIRTMRWGQNQKFDPMGLETIPVNRYTADRKFQQLLKPHGPPMLYTMKETLKRLIPMQRYEQLRRMAFKFRKSN